MKLTQLTKLAFKMTQTDAQNVAKNLNEVLRRISSVYESSDSSTRAPKMPRLVAVSKTKPKELIIEAYEAGHRHFGENYVEELVEKSQDLLLREKCPDIQWHFIGNCQSNKANKVVLAPNLSVIETVATKKLAGKLQTQCSRLKKTIGIMVQVNTSGEENKNGLEPENVSEFVQFIMDHCPNLKFQGLMTIGALGHSLASAARASESGPNPDFVKLLECRKDVSTKFSMNPDNVELSMGMSNDFEEAIKMGSTNVRVGSSIFGARNYPPKPDKVKEMSEKLLETSISSSQKENDAEK